MTEKQLQTSIITYLRDCGYFVWNVNSGKIKINTSRGVRYFMGAPTGHSDIQGINNDGRFIAIEVKLPERKNNVTDHQLEFLRKVKERGGISGVACSKSEALFIIESN